MFQPQVPTPAKALLIFLTTFAQLKLVGWTGAIAVLLGTAAAADVTLTASPAVTQSPMPVLLLTAVIAAVTSQVTWHHMMTHSGLTGMRTRTPEEQIAEYLDLSVVTGVPVTYQQAALACAYARTLAHLQRLRGTASAATFFALPVAWLTHTSLALGAAQLLFGAVAWIGAAVGMSRLSAAHQPQKQLVLDIGEGLMAAIKTAA